MCRFKNRLIALLLAAVLVFGMGFSAFAVGDSKSEQRLDVIIEFYSEPLSIKNEEIEKSTFSAEVQSTTEKIGNDTELLKKNLRKMDGGASVKHEYKTLLSGVSANIRENDINAISALPNVKKIYIDQTYTISKPLMDTAVEIAAVPLVWETGFYGEGQVVAVIDTGFDLEHEQMSLSDGTKTAFSKKTIEAAVKSGKLNATKNSKFTADDLYKSDKVPFAFDYAEEDADVFPTGWTTNNAGYHGVGVSSIAIGNNKDNPSEVKGVAPEAQFVAMKVANDNGSVLKKSSELAAFEDALTLGVDVINYSVGESRGFSRYDEIPGVETIDDDKFFDRIKAAGISINVAAGNESRVSNLDGFTPYKNFDNGTMGAPAAAEFATAVASVDNYVKYDIFSYGDKEIRFKDLTRVFLNNDFYQAILADATQELEMGYVGRGTEEDFKNTKIKGKVAILDLGSTSFKDMMHNAYAAGAVALLIIYNEDDHSTNMPFEEVPESEHMAVGIITQTNAKAIRDDIAGGTLKKVKFKSDSVIAERDKPIVMSDFSSWGISTDLKLKPDISAPGGSIRYAMPSEKSGDGKKSNAYTVGSGTSMASPFNAGATAIVREYVGKNEKKFENVSGLARTDLFDCLLMSTAKIVYDAEGVPYSPRKQGAGLLDLSAATKTDAIIFTEEKIDRAIFPNVKEDTRRFSKVSIGEIGMKNTFTFDTVVKNYGAAEKEYSLDASVLVEKPNINLGKAYASGKDTPLESAKVTFSGERVSGKNVKISAGKESKIKVTVTISDEELKTYYDYSDAQGFYIEGFLQLTEVSDEKAQLSVPYLGFYGDWEGAALFDESAYSGKETYANDSIGKGCFMLLRDNRGDIISVAGDNIYDAKEAQIAPEERFIAVQPAESGEFGITPNLALLRNAKRLEFGVFDSDGKEVDAFEKKGNEYAKSKNYVRKTIYGRLRLFERNALSKITKTLPDGNYRYTITGYPNESKRGQTVSFPFVVDGQKPKFVSEPKIVGENGRYYLEFSASDNHYLQGIEIAQKGVGAENVKIPVDNTKNGYAAGEVIDFKIDLFSVGVKNFEKIDVELCDYALNSNTTENVPGYDGGYGEEGLPTADEVKVEVSMMGDTATITAKASDFTAAFEASDKNDLIIKTNHLNLRMDRKAAASILAVGDGELRINLLKTGSDKLSNGARDKVKDNKIKTLEIYKGSKKLNEFEGGRLTLTLPSDGARPNDSTVLYLYRVLDSGEIAPIKNSRFDSSSDTMACFVERTGSFIIGYEPPVRSFFNDVENRAWFAIDVIFMSARGVVNGVGDDNFSPHSYMTRAELACVLYNVLAEGEKAQNDDAFADVEDGAWYADAVNWCAENGLVQGWKEGDKNLFEPEGYISKQDAATILMRYMTGWKALATEKIKLPVKFTDDAEISDYAREPIMNLQAADAINGVKDGNGDVFFYPKMNVTRSEICRMFRAIY